MQTIPVYNIKLDFLYMTFLIIAILFAIAIIVTGAYFIKKNARIFGSIVILAGCVIILTATLAYIVIKKDEEKHLVKEIITTTSINNISPPERG